METPSAKNENELHLISICKHYKETGALLILCKLMKVKISKIILKNKIIAQLRVCNIPHIPRAWTLTRKNSATKVLFTNFKRKWVGGNSIYNFIIRYKLYIAVKNSESHSTFFYTI